MIKVFEQFRITKNNMLVKYLQELLETINMTY